MTYELYPTVRVGVVNLKAARILAFIIIVLAVIACATACVLAVWEIIQPVFAGGALESLGIVSTSVAILIILNEGFGPAVRGYPLARTPREPDLRNTTNSSEK